ncbi:protoporphyrinogen oxidase [Nonomuraea sp. NPDC048826]|uniref:protoporphyrinogen oxidase n=1 Tax=Nonomuraea sp. NPDC048826 TaxID=3364347 RepID=UPI00371F4695
MEGNRAHVAVIGGGISGLAAAWHLKQGAGEQIKVTVLDGASRVGGKLYATEVAGVSLDVGAEAMLARRPEGKELARAVGMGDDLVHPGTASSAIYSRGVLRSLPKGQIMGVPSDLAELAKSGILSPGGLLRVPLDQIFPATLVRTDVSVAAYIRARVGGEVLDRLVEPLLGGVYAGRSEMLSLEATMPRVAAAARSERSLLAAARHIAQEAPKDAGPVFTTLRAGMGSLPEAVAKASGADVRTGVTVRELHRTEHGWRLVTGPVPRPETVEADAVIIAVPAPAAARLLKDEVPGAATELARIQYASMAVVTLAYPAAAFPERPARSGYLVPPVEGRVVKAVTFSSVKWPHLSRDLVLLRCSIGRIGEEHLLQRDDAELVSLAMAEMSEVMGARGLPLDTRVTRWGGALPQYNVGHIDRVARVHAAVSGQPALAVCGAAYDGLGIPACIATARTAASRILDHLSQRGESES